jgi:hypothetical protein
MFMPVCRVAEDFKEQANQFFYTTVKYCEDVGSY